MEFGYIQIINKSEESFKHGYRMPIPLDQQSFWQDSEEQHGASHFAIAVLTLSPLEHLRKWDVAAPFVFVNIMWKIIQAIIQLLKEGPKVTVVIGPNNINPGGGSSAVPSESSFFNFLDKGYLDTQGKP
ncbi:hypothetical protein ACJX0J_031236 [Zea mays]